MQSKPVRHRLRVLAESLERRLQLTFGQLDPFFGGGDGKMLTDLTPSDSAQTVLVQPDGKVIVVGTVFATISINQTFNRIGVARYLPNGTPDLTFSSDGVVIVDYAGQLLVDTFAFDAALQADGKIVITGQSNSVTNPINGSDTLVVRLNTDGSTDTSFNGVGALRFDSDGTVIPDTGMSVRVQSDGKLVVASTVGVPTLSGNARFGLARINSNGTLDTSFAGDGTAQYVPSTSSAVRSLEIDSLGRYVVAGVYSTSLVTFDMAVIRVSNTTALLDTTFSGDGIATVDLGENSSCLDLALDTANRVVLAGYVESGIIGSTTRNVAIARLTSSGAIDTSFNDVPFPVASNGDGRLSFTFDLAGGSAADDVAFSLAITTGNGIFVGGYTTALVDVAGVGTTRNFALAKINADGGFDTSFDTDGKRVLDVGGDDYAHSLVLTRDNSLLVAGTSGDDFALMRFRGALDIEFDGDGANTVDFGNTETLQSVVVQPDGKYLVAGSWNTTGASEFLIARYRPDGGFDGTFNQPGAAVGFGSVNVNFGLNPAGGADFATDLVLQPDGKIVVVGYTNNVNGTPAGGGNDFAVARLNSDATFDTTFSGDGKFTLNWGADDRINAVALQPDGKILLAGSWDGGSSDFAIMRLNVDGTLDTTFGGGTIGAGSGRTNVTFGSGTFGGAEFATDIAVLPNGNIVVVGYTNNINGTAAPGGNDVAVAVLTPTGTLLTSFSGDGKFTADLGGSDDRAAAVAIRSDTRIVIGATATFGGNGDFALLRLLPTGTLDTTFAGAGAETYTLGSNDVLTDIAILDSDQIIAVGYSNAFGTGFNRFTAIRLASAGTIDTTFQPPDEGGFQKSEFRYSFGVDAQVNGLAIAPNGNMVLVGTSIGNFATVVMHHGSVAATDFQYMFNGAPTGFANKPAARVWFTAHTNLSSIAPADLVLNNTTTSTIIPAASLSIALAGNGAIDVFYTGTLGSAAGVLPDGSYTLTYTVGSIADSAGNTNTRIKRDAFFVLAGDANRDRVVNFDDLLILSQNYGQAGKTFSQGNFSYSADGLVSFDDLLILSQRYGTSLLTSTTSTAGSKRTSRTNDDILS